LWKKNISLRRAEEGVNVTVSLYGLAPLLQ
jgi:hypothetical protein